MHGLPSTARALVTAEKRIRFSGVISLPYDNAGISPTIMRVVQAPLGPKPMTIGTTPTGSTLTHWPSTVRRVNWDDDSTPGRYIDGQYHDDISKHNVLAAWYHLVLSRARFRHLKNDEKKWTEILRKDKWENCLTLIQNFGITLILLKGTENAKAELSKIGEKINAF